MSERKSSIRRQLTAYTSCFVLLVLGLAGASSAMLALNERQTSYMDKKLFAGSTILGELSYQLSEFRIAEGYSALAKTAEDRAKAETSANEHQQIIENLQREYAALPGNHPQAELDKFRSAWQSYEAEHNRWCAASAAGTVEGTAKFGSEIEQLYHLTVAAADELVHANTAAAHERAASVARVAQLFAAAAMAISIGAIGFAAWLISQVRRGVTRPLECITSALSQLAAGDRDAVLPDFDRNDELGEMAKAFHVFRANANALELAHEETRKAQQEALTHARHDSLTGLRNRRAFAADIGDALGKARSGSKSYVVLLIDLDQFKPINDLFGHQVGDAVLCEVANRLQAAIRETDTAVRLGGDEFALISEGGADAQANTETATAMATRILETLRTPITVGTHRVEIGASIGIALSREGNTDLENLLHEADIAMYRAKRDGRGTFRFFEQSMDEELRAKAALEADLRQALVEDAIKPFYQPLVDIRMNRICAFEVLARWQHPTRGFVPPDVFIPLCEELGLIGDLTGKLLRRACREARDWGSNIRISVNISPVQLVDPGLPSWILGILEEESFPPARLEIEVTESALVSDLPIAKAILTHLQSTGVTVALDDFGTGYSTLYHLRALKFDKVKIDRSFVQGMLDNPDSEKIVDAILGLARNLQLPVVAEGIENPAMLWYLARHGCDYGQGYFFGKAMPAENVPSVLEQPRVRDRSAA
jgi:diguanylate cyclase (GGDEF)-like protein